MNDKERMNEQEMRDANVPFIKTAHELSEYIEGLIEQQHDYGTCVYAMSMAAVAAFNYVASALGVTGFQASCADLDIIRRTRHMECPFMLIKLEDRLYPQYDVQAKVMEFLYSQDSVKWLREEAQKKLQTAHEGSVHTDVKAHWEKLVQS